jgi:hypothetical protein
MERSRGSVLGMSFDTNFRLSMGMDDDDDHEDGGGGVGDFAAEDFGGEGEFAPDTASFGGGEGGFSPNHDGPGAFVDPRSYNNTKVLLDALCDGDAFYEGASGGNGDYAYFDMKKFERATDGNLWAGSQHWKKKPIQARKNENGGTGKKTVMFDDGTGEKKERKKTVKKDRLYIDFGEATE